MYQLLDTSGDRAGCVSVWGVSEGVSEEGGQAAQRGDGVSELKSGVDYAPDYL